MKYLISIVGIALLMPLGLRAQQSNVNLDYNPQKDTEGLIPFSASVNSPEVRDDNTVTFRLKAPNAQKVVLPVEAIHTANNLGREPIPFTKGEDGVWTLTIGPLKPDMYAYHFNVDGVQIFHLHFSNLAQLSTGNGAHFFASRIGRTLLNSSSFFEQH